jgi:U4/U6.U5 tri-snRNP-associated protein 2
MDEKMNKRQKVDDTITSSNNPSTVSNPSTSSSNNPSSSTTYISPHLPTIQRSHLDFDFDHVCSVTLSNRNVHVCLVCGKFFSGRGPDSPLMSHVLSMEHFICMSLTTGIVYSMPENSIVNDPSLEDIRYNIHPTYTENEIQEIASSSSNVQKKPLSYRLDVHGITYLPGIIGMGMNDKTDFMISVIQCLFRVPKLCAFFLNRNHWERSSSSVTRAFGELICQAYNPKRFKSTISPHSFLQAVSAVSHKKFQIAVRSDASLFLAWLLEELHGGLVHNTTAVMNMNTSTTSIIHECFRGEIHIETTTLELKREYATGEHNKVEQVGPTRRPPMDDSLKSDFDDHDDDGKQYQKLGSGTSEFIKDINHVTIPFSYLSLDLPTKSVFTNEMEPGTSIIPTTTLFNLLSKYDGMTTTEIPLPGGKIERKRYRVIRYPEVCIFLFKRFTKNNFYIEKNRCVVTLPIQGLELKSSNNNNNNNHRYDLIANITHENKVMSGEKDPIGTGLYKANVRQPAIPDDVWFEAHDLTITKTMSQLVAVSETHLAFYLKE